MLCYVRKKDRKPATPKEHTHLILPLCRGKERRDSGMAYVNLAHVMGRSVSSHLVGTTFLPFVQCQTTIRNRRVSGDFDGPDDQVWWIRRGHNSAPKGNE